MRVSEDIKCHPSPKQLAKIPDLTDQRFGRLIAKEYVGYGNWKCICDCGNNTVARNSALMSGNRISCGCAMKDYLSGPRIDRTGVRYGRLVVVEHVEGQNWLCKCDCGNTVVVDGRNLTTGHSRSCGCYKAERTSETKSTHGESKTRLYGVWKGMNRRCYCENEPAYKNYGGRGIKICDEWKEDYTAFRDWALENGYDESAPYGECTIDRIDVNGNYEPDNCRFISLCEQSRNVRRNRIVEVLSADGTILGTYRTLRKAAEATGVSVSSIYRACTGRQDSTHGMIMRYAS